MEQLTEREQYWITIFKMDGRPYILNDHYRKKPLRQSDDFRQVIRSLTRKGLVRLMDTGPRIKRYELIEK